MSQISRAVIGYPSGHYLACLRRPAVPQKKISESIIIESGPYWPSCFSQDGRVLASCFLCAFMDLGSVSIHKAAKKEFGQYRAIFKAWCITLYPSSVLFKQTLKQTQSSYDIPRLMKSTGFNWKKTNKKLNTTWSFCRKGIKDNFYFRKNTSHYKQDEVRVVLDRGEITL